MFERKKKGLLQRILSLVACSPGGLVRADIELPGFRRQALLILWSCSSFFLFLEMAPFLNRFEVFLAQDKNQSSSLSDKNQYSPRFRARAEMTPIQRAR